MDAAEHLDGRRPHATTACVGGMWRMDQAQPAVKLYLAAGELSRLAGSPGNE